MIFLANHSDWTPRIIGEQGVRFTLRKDLDPFSGCILNHPGPRTATSRPIQCFKGMSVGIRCHAVQIGTRKEKVDPASLAEGKKELKKVKEQKAVSDLCLLVTA